MDSRVRGNDLIKMRIASLIPSGTDIAVSLGLQNNLVGRSHACDHPAARNLPVLTRSLLPPDLPPAEIDAAVREALNEGDGSLYITNRETLHAVHPDVVLTQSICDVCAVNARRAAEVLPVGAQMVTLGATGFESLWEDLRQVAGVTETNAELLIVECKRRLDDIHQIVKNLHQPRVLVLEWTDPPFLGGHWVPEMVAAAGGIPVPDWQGQVSRQVLWDEIIAHDPDVIVIAPCGYSLEETRKLGEELLSQSIFKNLRAVKKNAVWITDATHHYSRCTPACVRGVEVLAQTLFPRAAFSASLKPPVKSEIERL
jgi:iron complex transport system substrate-binding protein